ncbi:ciliary microtubule inner protein 7-like isoform X2 [Rhinoraja longicauda]
MAGAITGSWFPTGFHGHARSKSRNDIFQEYRLQAKPPPPEKLLKRLRESPLKHNFSKHDSRLVFYDGATYMENNKGKWRAKSAFGRSREFNKDLISWIPTQTEGPQQWPLISTYQADFWHHRNAQSAAVMIPQLLVPRVRRLITAAHPGSETMQTTYRQYYGHCQPNPKVQTNVYTGEVQSKPMETEASFVYVNPKPKLANGEWRPRSSPSECITVADCLSWYVPQTSGTDNEKSHGC